MKLGPFLDKVQVYASVLKQQMESTKATYVPAKPVAKAPKPTKKPVSTRQGRRAKRAKTEPEEAVDDVDDVVPTDEEEIQAFKQPALVTGAKLKDYQLEGVAWMVGLYQNGISGILGTLVKSWNGAYLIPFVADEMGLGKVCSIYPWIEPGDDCSRADSTDHSFSCATSRTDSGAVHGCLSAERAQQLGR